MAVVQLATKADLESRFSISRVLEFTDDANTSDPSNVTVIARVNGALLEASGIAYGILGNAWASKTIPSLATDPSIIGAVCDIAMGLLARRRSEFLGPDGKTLYSSNRVEAERVLKGIANRERSPESEAVAGDNLTIPTATNRPASVLVFQSNSQSPSKGPGGF